jgi:hypothetical protein
VERNFELPHCNIGQDSFYLGVDPSKSPSIIISSDGRYFFSFLFFFWKSATRRFENFVVCFSIQRVMLTFRSAQARFDAQSATGVLNYPLKRGKWYFECRVLSSTFFIMLGWCSHQFLSDPSARAQGVSRGDNSWGVELHPYEHNTYVNMLLLYLLDVVVPW